MGAIIRGLGMHVPDTILTNSDFEKMIETTDEWITTRTGIRERRILDKNSSLLPSDFGAAAAIQALEKAGVKPEEVGAIIAGAMVPDKLFPATACFIQDKIGAKNAFAFDITAACAGFVYGVDLASMFIDSGRCENVLVVGAELGSRAVNWSDRNTCILFGDAGAAALFGRGPVDRGVIRSLLRSDGSQSGLLYLDEAGSQNAGMYMDGKQVFKLAVSEVSKIVRDALALEGLETGDVDLLVMHQANIRIISAIADKLKIPMEKVVVNVERYGNTSSASIPLALYEAEQAGRLKSGMLVALAAVGGGMSWGCNLLRW